MMNFLSQQQPEMQTANVMNYAAPFLAKRAGGNALAAMHAMQPGANPLALAFAGQQAGTYGGGSNSLAGVQSTIDDGDPRRGAFPNGANTAAGSGSVDSAEGVHPDLLKVIARAREISGIPFTVTEGLRDIERQRKLVAQGYSKTMNSRHLHGNAIDVAPLVNGKPSYDWEQYYPLAEVMKQAARDVGVNVEWGGDWKSFKDGPHWQLAK